MADNTNPEVDPFKEIFGEDDPEEPEAPQVIPIPDDERFGTFKGKTLDDLVKAYDSLQAEFTKTAQDKAELVRLMEKAGKEAPAPVPPAPEGDPQQELMWSIALEMKLDKLAAKDPLVEEHRDELMEILSTVQNPAQRVMDKVIKEAVTYVKGRHFDEHMNRERPPVSIKNDATGRIASNTKEHKMTLTDAQKAVLDIYYDGDMKAAKVAIFGEED